MEPKKRKNKKEKKVVPKKLRAFVFYMLTPKKNPPTNPAAWASCGSFILVWRKTKPNTTQNEKTNWTWIAISKTKKRRKRRWPLAKHLYHIKRKRKSTRKKPCCKQQQILGFGLKIQHHKKKQTIIIPNPINQQIHVPRVSSILRSRPRQRGMEKREGY